MKKSVNNKTFDEIFGQRGKKIDVDQMKMGGVYLLVTPDRVYNWMIEFYCFIPKRFLVEVVDTAALSSDDATFFNQKPEDEKGLLLSELGYIHEATPDQIALLKAYKNDQP